MGKQTNKLVEQRHQSDPDWPSHSANIEQRVNWNLTKEIPLEYGIPMEQSSTG